MPEFFTVGKIVNTHGIRGEVKVISTTDFPEERYRKGSKLLLFLQQTKAPLELEVENWRTHKNFDLLTFKGYPSINDVENFKGGILKVSKDQLEPLPSGEYYFHEIIGCTVKTTANEEIGEITEILIPGANDVWTVKTKEGKIHYIPYIEDVVKKINVDEKTIWIEPMEGLLD